MRQPKELQASINTYAYNPYPVRNNPPRSTSYLLMRRLLPALSPEAQMSAFCGRILLIYRCTCGLIITERVPPLRTIALVPRASRIQGSTRVRSLRNHNFDAASKVEGRRVLQADVSADWQCRYLAAAARLLSRRYQTSSPHKILSATTNVWW